MVCLLAVISGRGPFHHSPSRKFTAPLSLCKFLPWSGVAILREKRVRLDALKILAHRSVFYPEAIASTRRLRQKQLEMSGRLDFGLVSRASCDISSNAAKRELFRYRVKQGGVPCKKRQGTQLETSDPQNRAHIFLSL